MDFPVCPSCHQSVIDDDAKDCPFCGASMKATPTTKSAAKPAPTALKAAGGKSAPGKSAPGKPALSAKPTLPGDDFPFDIELTSGKAAIPSMPNPTKMRSWKVICPMCDTPCYLPESAAGQEVRCANTTCAIPVFTAPAPKKVEVAAPVQKKSSKAWLFVGLFSVVALIGGGIVVANLGFGSGNSGGRVLTDEEKAIAKDFINGNKKSNQAAPKNQTIPEAPKETNAAIDNATLVPQILKLMDEACINPVNQTNKTLCRQLTAEANAVCGKPADARKNLDKLDTVGGVGLSYYRILPLLELFWAEYNSGDKTKSSKTLDSAMAEVPKIPSFGRIRFEINGRLAAALVAADRIPDALNRIENVPSTELDAQLAAQLQMAIDGAVEPMLESHSSLPCKFPQAVAATASLLNRGQPDAALRWVTSQTDPDAKVECMACWAEVVSRRAKTADVLAPDGIIAGAIKDLNNAPALAAKVWARAGYGRLMRKDAEGAKMAIDLAQAQLAQVTLPTEPVKIPEDDVAAIIRFKPPLAQPFILAASAAGEIALVQAQSKSTIPAAEKSLDLAISYLDATAPSLASAQAIYDHFEGMDRDARREFIKKKLNIKTNHQNNLKENLIKYKESLKGIKIASQQRFDLQLQLLSRLRGAGVGLNSKVWIIVDSRARAENINARDDFFVNPLPGELIEGLKGTAEAQAILGAWKMKSKEEAAPPRPFSAEFKELIAKKDFANAVKAGGPRTVQRDEVFMLAAGQLAANKKLSVAFQFIPLIPDPSVREDCYRIAAGVAAAHDQVDAVWAEVEKVAPQTEKVAICRGLIAGLQISK